MGSVCVPEGRMAEAEAFYGGVLGLPKEGIANEDWVEYQAGSLTIGLDSAPFLPPQGEPQCEIRIGLAVEDVEAAVRELRVKGIEPAIEPILGHEPCDIAGIRDPFGNLIMLHRRTDGTVG
ncbi:MAG: VOC family protein [Thermaerobacter sp.]|nr:VOC family protein [Thermaerobacter sp.]